MKKLLILMLMLAVLLCGCVASAETEESDCIGRWVMTGALYLGWDAENPMSKWMGYDEIVQALGETTIDLLEDGVCVLNHGDEVVDVQCWWEQEDRDAEIYVSDENSYLRLMVFGDTLLNFQDEVVIAFTREGFPCAVAPVFDATTEMFVGMWKLKVIYCQEHGFYSDTGFEPFVFILKPCASTEDQETWTSLIQERYKGQIQNIAQLELVVSGETEDGVQETFAPLPLVKLPGGLSMLGVDGYFKGVLLEDGRLVMHMPDEDIHLWEFQRMETELPTE